MLTKQSFTYTFAKMALPIHQNEGLTAKWEFESNPQLAIHMEVRKTILLVKQWSPVVSVIHLRKVCHEPCERSSTIHKNI